MLSWYLMPQQQQWLNKPDTTTTERQGQILIQFIGRFLLGRLYNKGCKIRFINYKQLFDKSNFYLKVQNQSQSHKIWSLRSRACFRFP